MGPFCMSTISPMFYSPLDFFGPARVIVVSEERLREAERKEKVRQIEAVGQRIEDLSNYKRELEKDLLAFDAPKSEQKET